MDLRIIHHTLYRYGEKVSFGPHHLMIRPRDSFDIRVLKATLTTAPAANVSWMHDIYGNSVAVATFAEESDQMLIESELILRRYESALPRDAAGPWRGGAPVDYSEDERIVLNPFILTACADPAGNLNRFAHEAVSFPAGQRHPLFGLSDAIHNRLAYVNRFEEGTQAPLDTLVLNRGSCRDYAWLFIECARHLGYAARFVSGYLHNAAQGGLIASEGFSHAWAEVFVPGDGWIEFDPTNALIADRQLIRVAVTRTPHEAIPVSGSFFGASGVAALEVNVRMEPIDYAAVA